SDARGNKPTNASGAEWDASCRCYRGPDVGWSTFMSHNHLHRRSFLKNNDLIITADFNDYRFPNWKKVFQGVRGGVHGAPGGWNPTPTSARQPSPFTFNACVRLLGPCSKTGRTLHYVGFSPPTVSDAMSSRAAGRGSVAPSMGLHAARDAYLQLESALNQIAVEIVAS
ncbi:unnamed protein product, partial [Pleuronectes platessa]